MCQGCNHFSGFLPHIVLAKLATSSIRVRLVVPQGAQGNTSSKQWCFVIYDVRKATHMYKKTGLLIFQQISCKDLTVKYAELLLM